MRRETIIYIWVGGLALAVALYLIGPDSFLIAWLNLIASIEAGFHALMSFLGAQAFNVVRAAAIAIFVVFLVLSFLAMRRGVRAGWMLVLVPLVFLALVWRPDGFWPLSISRWFTALLIVTIGAIAMTRRLMGPPPSPQRPVQPPWPPAPGRPE